MEALRAIHAAGLANGVDDLRMLGAAEAMAMEGALHCVGALYSPSTGIVDSHALMLALQAVAESHGALLALGSPVQALQAMGWDVGVAMAGEDAPSLRARLVVNAAGLDAVRLAQSLAGFGPPPGLGAYYAKGSYFSLAGRAPFSRLIYPVPEPGGLGVHLTLDLGGQARFGPDVEWIDEPNYEVDIRRADGFYSAIRTYWPDLRDGDLIPAYAGVRPKLAPPGAPAADFQIIGPQPDGPGLISLLGIESPGLTACLAIADRVADMAVRRLG